MKEDSPRKTISINASIAASKGFIKNETIMTCVKKKSALTGYLVSETILWKRDIRARQDWFHHADRVLRSADLSGRAVLGL